MLHLGFRINVCCFVVQEKVVILSCCWGVIFKEFLFYFSVTFPRDHELGYVKWRVHTKKVGHDIVKLSKRECDCWRDILLHFE